MYLIINNFDVLTVDLGVYPLPGRESWVSVSKLTLTNTSRELQ